jgi:preprotein translocase subunit SecG
MALSLRVAVVGGEAFVVTLFAVVSVFFFLILFFLDWLLSKKNLGSD